MLEEEGNSYIDLSSENIDVLQIPKAKSVLEFLVWDPAGHQKLPLPVCTLPVEHSFRGARGTHKGCWTMLELVGRVLKASGNLLRGLTFDSHCTHLFIKKVIHGQLSDIDMQELMRIPFFSELKYKPMPKNNLPRLPVAICLHEGDAFYAINGPCHSAASI